MRSFGHHHGQIGARPTYPAVELFVGGMNVDFREGSGAALVTHALQRIAVAADACQFLTAAFAHHIEREARLTPGLNMERNRDSTLSRLAGRHRALNARRAAYVIESVVCKRHRMASHLLGQFVCRDGSASRHALRICRAKSASKSNDTSTLSMSDSP